MSKEKDSVGKVLGTIGIAAAAFGAYFLYNTKDGSKTRDRVKSWMFKMKGDVLEKIEEAKEVSREKYAAIVDEVSVKYRALQNIDHAELDRVAAELKSHWDKIKKQFREGEKRARKVK